MRSFQGLVMSVLLVAFWFSVPPVTPEPGTLRAEGAGEAPRLRGPQNGALLQGIGPVTLEFTLPAGATAYQLQLVPYREDGPGVNLIRNPETSYTLQAPLLGSGPYVLLPSMTYSWKLRATDAGTLPVGDDAGWGPWSEVWSFATPAASADSIHAKDPPVGTVVASRNPTLVWTDDNPSVFYYEIQVSKDARFDTNPATAVAPVLANLVHGGESAPPNSWTAPPAFQLELGCVYYWRVRPRVQGDGTPVMWPPPFSFVTPIPLGAGASCVPATLPGSP